MKRIRKTLGADELHTRVQDFEQAETIEEVVALVQRFNAHPTFDEQMRAVAEESVAAMVSAGWPRPGATVIVRGEEWTQDEDPVDLSRGPFRIQDARDFIHERVACFSEEWYHAEIAHVFFWQFEKSTDLNAKFHYAYRLGQLLEQRQWRAGYKPAILRDRGSERGRRKVRAGAAVHNEERMERAQTWQSWARARAAELIAENSRRTKGRCAELIAAEIAERAARVEIAGDCEHKKPVRGCFVCAAPSRKTIENALAK